MGNIRPLMSGFIGTDTLALNTPTAVTFADKNMAIAMVAAAPPLHHGRPSGKYACAANKTSKDISQCIARIEEVILDLSPTW